MRPPGLGRKSWLHIGSETAEAKAAAIASVVETCRRLGIMPGTISKMSCLSSQGEKTRSLFPADLFIQPGDLGPIVDEDMGPSMCELSRQVGVLAHEESMRRVLDWIEALNPRWVHAMHGGTIPVEFAP